MLSNLKKAKAYLFLVDKVATDTYLRRSFTDANPPARKTFGFTLILREGTAPKTAFGIVGSI